MANQAPGRMELLGLLEASQISMEASEKALKAAEEAFAAAKLANSQAKTVLETVSEAFVQKDRKLTTMSQREPGSGEDVTHRTRSIDYESDEDADDMENFVMLSTNKNPVKDVEDDFIVTLPKFFLISSTGPAADYGCMLGLYRKDQAKDGTTRYFHEEDDDPETGYCDNPYQLFKVQGAWVVSSFEKRENNIEYISLYLKAVTPSQSPTSVKWQCCYDQDQNLWQDDQTLTVTSLSERPTCECEITITLSANIAQEMPQVSGVYRPDGTYYEGRPVLRHSLEHYKLFVSRGRWRVGLTFGLGDECYQQYLCSRTAPGPCPADPRAAIDESTGYWGFMTKQPRGGWESNGIGVNVTCSKHNRHNDFIV